jgi:nucleoside-diphosphate-sugar epimerase
MKLFVTGICGRLGRAIAQVAAERNIDVIGIDQVDWPSDVDKPKGVQTLVGSYTDLDLLRKHFPQCDAVAHTAGPHGGHVDTVDWAGFIDGNVTAVCRMLEIARDSGVKSVVLSSTMEVLLGRDWKSSGAAIVDEDYPPVTDSQYATSRLLLEQMAIEFSRQFDYGTCSMRYMGFGYADFEKLGPSLICRSVHGHDVATAVIAAAKRDDLHGEVFHIGTDTRLNNRDIIDAFSDPVAVLERIFPGAHAILEQQGFKLNPQHFWPATSIRKAKLILGWEPQYTFEKWLELHGWNNPGGPNA